MGGVTPKNRPKSLDPDNHKLYNKVSSSSNSSKNFNHQNHNSNQTTTTAKPKSPHPVRRLQSFIHQKNRDRYLVKKRSASDDDEDDYSDDNDDRNRVNRRNSSFTPRLAPVTSPASTTILKASPSLNAITSLSPCASRTIYNRMQPN